jgi:hypothetical protein
MFAYFRLMFVAAVAVLIVYAPFVWISSGVLGSIPLTIFFIIIAVANFIYAVSRIPRERMNNADGAY